MTETDGQTDRQTDRQSNNGTYLVHMEHGTLCVCYKKNCSQRDNIMQCFVDSD